MVGTGESDERIGAVRAVVMARAILAQPTMPGRRLARRGEGTIQKYAKPLATVPTRKSCRQPSRTKAPSAPSRWTCY